MFIIIPHKARDQEHANNFKADSRPTWSATVTYKAGDYVKKGNWVYYSVKKDNLNFDPATNKLYWVVAYAINEKNIYDIYPDTFTVNEGMASLEVSYNVTNVDVFFLGNIHGKKVTVTAGGTFTKNIPRDEYSMIGVWGVTGYEEVADFKIDLNSYTGRITVKIEAPLSDGNPALGFVYYGHKVDMGCTLINTVTYNIRSGVQLGSNIASLARIQQNSYEEITIPILIKNTQQTKDVVPIVAKYRGTPVLIYADDTGAKEEYVFFGVYTNIDASLAFRNRYKMTLRSLRYRSFTPLTEEELRIIENTKTKAEDSENNSTGGGGGATTPVHTVGVKAGVPAVADFTNELRVFYDTGDFRKRYALDGGTVKEITPRIDGYAGVPPASYFTAGLGRSIVFDENNPCDKYYLDAGTVKKCTPKVNSKAGVPVVADFANGSKFIFNESSPCDLYYNNAGTITKCSGGDSIDLQFKISANGMDNQRGGSHDPFLQKTAVGAVEQSVNITGVQIQFKSIGKYRVRYLGAIVSGHELVAYQDSLRVLISGVDVNIDATTPNFIATLPNGTGLEAIVVETQEAHFGFTI